MANDALRILFDAHQIGRHQTGNETYVRALLAEFAMRADVRVTALVAAAGEADPAVAGLARKHVPTSGLLRLGAMSLAAHQTRPDVLHAIYFAPFLARIPTVLTVHDISYEIHPQFFSRTERWRGRILIRDSARRAQVVITVSETSRRDIIERYGLPEDMVIAIHNGVADRFLAVPERPMAPIGDRPVRVLALGTLQPRKNLMRLLDALRLASKTRPFELRVVGPDGYQAAAIRDALDGNVEVEVVGYVADDGLVNEYLGADMLVYPSIYEGFGLPVVEAMACGTPVVTSTGGSLPEVAGDAAVIIDPLDVSAMARAMLELADDTEHRAALIARGRSRAQDFTWQASAARYVQVYRSVAGA